MLYRPATAPDSDAIGRLHADSWQRNYRGAFSDAFLDGDVLTDRLTVWGERLRTPTPDRRTIVAEDDGDVVGFVHIVFGDDPTWGALVDNLHVSHSLKRRGVGRQLMSGAGSAVREQTPSTGLYLWVLEQNTAAQGFYESIGGTRVERGFGSPPGGGRPPRLRYSWADPTVLIVEE